MVMEPMPSYFNVLTLDGKGGSKKAKEQREGSKQAAMKD